MNVVFWISDKDLDKRISELLGKGIVKSGKDRFRVINRKKYIGPVKWADVSIVLGVKSNSKDILNDHLLADKNIIFIDKGYVRIRSPDPMLPVEYYRFSVNGFQPTHYFQSRKRKDDRWRVFNIDLSPMEFEGEHIVFAGSSAKYSRFFKMPDPTEYATEIFKSIRERSLREVVYRPKPSWKGAVPIEGTVFSSNRRKLYKELEGAYALVTHGSNACFDAMIKGIPTFVLGDGITKSISKHSIEDINNPYYPSDDERYQLCCDLSHCQWNPKEMATGEAWKNLRKTISEISK